MGRERLSIKRKISEVVWLPVLGLFDMGLLVGVGMGGCVVFDDCFRIRGDN